MDFLWFWEKNTVKQAIPIKGFTGMNDVTSLKRSASDTSTRLTGFTEKRRV